MDSTVLALSLVGTAVAETNGMAVEELEGVEHLALNIDTEGGITTSQVVEEEASGGKGTGDRRGRTGESVNGLGFTAMLQAKMRTLNL